jgi:hypothetical protein
MASGSRAVSFLAARIDGIAHGCEVERRWPAGNNDQIDHLSYNAVHPGRILCATNLFVRAPLHEVAGVPWAPRTFAPIRSTWPPFSCSRTQPRRPLHKVVLDLHRNRGANTRKGVDHQPDQRPVAQVGQGIGVDRIEQGPGFVRLQHRSLATPLRVLCTTHGVGAIFADYVIASILDRLLHHSTTINIKGEMRSWQTTFASTDIGMGPGCRRIVLSSL